ncbi:MAG: guanylate kinase [Clostridia bacterium]|nr:guanylate kinase [Clostridia bacterium]
MEREKGLLIVLSGPSGVGKGVIGNGLLGRNPNMKFSVSATTRAPRPGEVEGVNYFYKTREEFLRMIENNEFLEYMEVFGANFYGTPRAYVEQELEMGHDILLDIDVKGAMNVKKAYPEAVTIFIAPPSMPILKSRLIGRGTESEEAVERRFKTAFTEMKRIPEYDYVIVNDVIDRAVLSVEAILRGESAVPAEIKI